MYNCEGGGRAGRIEGEHWGITGNETGGISPIDTVIITRGGPKV